MRKLLTLLVCGLSLAGAGCDQVLKPTQERLVIVHYREPMQFHCFTGRSQDPGDYDDTCFSGQASFYEITCITNKSQNPSDFTFDIRKVSAQLRTGGYEATPPITKDLPVTIPWSTHQKWAHPQLTANTQLVPRGTTWAPPGSYTYAFILVFRTNTLAQEQGVQHRLQYDATGGQPVLMVQEQALPVYRNSVRTEEFRNGAWRGTRREPLPACQ
jgi:hypothetical protein